jgi:ATP-dependent DNA helicase PIF1
MVVDFSVLLPCDFARHSDLSVFGHTGASEIHADVHELVFIAVGTDGKDVADKEDLIVYNYRVVIFIIGIILYIIKLGNDVKRFLRNTTVTHISIALLYFISMEFTPILLKNMADKKVTSIMDVQANRIDTTHDIHEVPPVEKTLQLALIMANHLTDKRLDRVYELLQNKQNVLLHGMAGAGKSYGLRFVLMRLAAEGVRIGCTATTGCAATGYAEFGLCGSTIHTYAGLGIGKDTADNICRRIYHHKEQLGRIRDVEILAIDEVSMMSAELFDLTDKVFRLIRRNNSPFGGVTLVICGDFMQLCPVEGRWAFMSAAYAACKFTCVTFSNPYRYHGDAGYYEIMKHMRMGKLTRNDLRLLQTRVGVKPDPSLPLPTTLYPRKNDAYTLNEKELAKLSDASAVTYYAISRYSGESQSMHAAFTHMLDDTIPSIITLKVGALVMLKANISVVDQLVNGTQGVVTTLRAESVDMKLVKDGRVITITYYKWKVGNDETWATRVQIPLILAWGLTIHKAQGATLDYMQCDLGARIFSPGQLYVAASRCRSLSTLYILALHPKSLRCDPDAKAYVIEQETETDDQVKCGKRLVDRSAKLDGGGPSRVREMDSNESPNKKKRQERDIMIP